MPDWFDTGTQPAQAPAQRYPGIIAAPPKTPDPYQVSKDQISQSNEARRLQMAEEDQQMQRERFRLEQEKQAQELGKKDAPYSQSALDAFDRAISTAQRLIGAPAVKDASGRIIKDAIPQHPGFGAAVGSGFDPQSWGSFNPISGKAFAGTNARDFGAELDAMKAQVFLPMVQSMKGMGALSNAEGEKLTAAIGALDTGQSEEQFKASLDRIIGDLQSYRDRGDPAKRKDPQSAATPGAMPPPLAGNGPDVDRSTPLAFLDAGPPSGTPPTLDGGASRFEQDPTIAGLQDEYRTRLGRGESADDLIAWATQATGGPVSEEFKQGVRDQVAFRQANPEVPVNNYNVEGISMRMVPQSLGRQALNEIGASPVGNFAMNAGDAVTAFNLDSMTANPEATRAGMSELNRRNPTASTLGQVAGGAMNALTIEAGLAKAGVSNALLRGMGADLAYGTAAGAGASDDNRLYGAGVGALAGFAGNMAGNALARGVGKITSGVSEASARRIAEAGPTTIGQAVSQSGRTGAMVKGVEDRLAGLPIVGNMVNARRTESLKAFNRNSFDRALKPIGEKVGDFTGEDAVQKASDLISDAYTRALAGKAVQADAPFANQFGKAIYRTMTLPRVGPEVADTIKAVVEPYMQGQSLSGEAMQQISRELRKIKAGYRNDPLSSRIGTSIDEVEDSVFGLFRRQAPEVLPDYNRAKAAARRLYILEDAVLAAKNSEGIFTASQLGNAEKASMKRFEGKRAASTGKGPFQELQRDAQKVLPNKVPDSGTAGRAAMLLAPGALAGSGAGVGYAAGDAQTGAGTGLTLGVLLAAAYSRAAQRAMVSAAVKRPVVVRKAGQALVKAGPTVGAVTGGATAADVSR